MFIKQKKKPKKSNMEAMFFGKPRGHLSATEIADAAYCERKVFLKGKLGERVENQEAKDRGNRIHKAAEDLGTKATPGSKDKRCFIATAVFGEDAHETNVLRKMRDERLLTTRFGRSVVAFYYQTSPTIANACNKSPLMKGAMNLILKSIVNRLEKHSNSAKQDNK